MHDNSDLALIKPDLFNIVDLEHYKFIYNINKIPQSMYYYVFDDAQTQDL